MSLAIFRLRKDRASIAMSFTTQCSSASISNLSVKQLIFVMTTLENMVRCTDLNSFLNHRGFLTGMIRTIASPRGPAFVGTGYDIQENGVGVPRLHQPPKFGLVATQLLRSVTVTWL